MMKTTIFLLFQIIMLHSCSTQTIFLKNLDTKNKKSNVKISSHFIFWGLWQDKKIDLIEECYGENPIMIKEYYNWLNISFNLITLGIYSPRTSEIWCEK